MSLGEKLANLRKRDKLSQEELAEKVGVARQTISKWELDETSPDIKQAQELSKIFHISLDELAGNEIGNIVVEKISNTEKLAGMIIKILKVAGVILLAMIVIDIVAFIAAVFFLSPIAAHDTQSKKELSCSVTQNDEKYVIEVANNGIFSCENCDTELYDNLYSLVNFDDINSTRNEIMDYFDEKDITCALKE